MSLLNSHKHTGNNTCTDVISVIDDTLQYRSKRGLLHSELEGKLEGITQSNFNSVKLKGIPMLDHNEWTLHLPLGLATARAELEVIKPIVEQLKTKPKKCKKSLEFKKSTKHARFPHFELHGGRMHAGVVAA